MKRIQKIFKGAGLLAVCALVAKLIGALYRIPLTNVLGAEGIGLYQMVFPLYTVLLTVSSGGLPVAISKSIAAKGESEGLKVVKYSLITLIVGGTIAALVIGIFSKSISGIQGNSNAALAYVGIAPALVFVAVISCFRGFFQGKQNMVPTAISQLIEQIVKLFFGLGLAYLFMPYGAAMGVFGSVLGVSLSELFAMGVLIIQYKIYKRKLLQKAKSTNSALLTETAAELTDFEEKRAHESALSTSRRSIIKEIYKIAVPVTLGSLVLPLTQVLDSLLIINILTAAGSNLSVATAMYGLVTGPVNSLINMPTVITLSMAYPLLPKVSRLFAAGEDYKKEVSKTMFASVALGLVFSAGLMILSGVGMKLLYSGGLSSEDIKLSASLLRVGAVSVFYVSILQVATAVLQGCDRAHIPAINLLIGAGVKVVLTLILLPIYGIVGAVAATAACYAVTCTLDVIAMVKIKSRKKVAF